MATKKQPVKAKKRIGTRATFTVSDCTFHGGVPQAHLEATIALANAMAEQAKAIQAIAASIKGPENFIRFGGAA